MPEKFPFPDILRQAKSGSQQYLCRVELSAFFDIGFSLPAFYLLTFPLKCFALCLTVRNAPISSPFVKEVEGARNVDATVVEGFERGCV